MAWGGNGSGQKWDFRQWGGHLAGNPLGVLPNATALTPYYLAFTFYPSWPTGTTNPYHLPPTTYAPSPTTHLYHLYHLYYPGGEMPKKSLLAKSEMHCGASSVGPGQRRSLAGSPTGEKASRC